MDPLWHGGRDPREPGWADGLVQLASGIRTYHAEVTQDGPWWSVRVPVIERTTQARTLAELEPMTRDLIATMENVPPDSFELHVSVTFPAREPSR